MPGKKVRNMNHKINFNLDFGNEPNANGRIYSSDVINKISEKINNGTIYLTNEVTSFNPNDVIGMSNSIGEVVSAKKVDDTKLEISVCVNDTLTKEMIENGMLDIVPNGTGNINEDTKYVEDYELKFFSVSTDSAFNKKKPVRYCYIVQGTEIDIVGVWSSKEEAIENAIEHVKDQGVTEYEMQEVNDDFVIILPKKYVTYEQARILRYIIQ